MLLMFLHSLQCIYGGFGFIQADIIIIESYRLGGHNGTFDPHMDHQGLHTIHGIPVSTTLIGGIFCLYHTMVMVFDKRASIQQQASRMMTCERDGDFGCSCLNYYLILLIQVNAFDQYWDFILSVEDGI